MLSNLTALNLAGDLPMPGFIDERGNAATNKTLSSITAADLADVLASKHDPDPKNGDEAAFFAAASKTLEDVVGALRRFEGRVHLLKQGLGDAPPALAALNDASAQVDTRLKAIGDALGEARHDVAVAKATPGRGARATSRA